MPDKRYGVIYADPPWQFEPYSRITGMDRAAEITIQPRRSTGSKRSTFRRSRAILFGPSALDRLTHCKGECLAKGPQRSSSPSAPKTAAETLLTIAADPRIVGAEIVGVLYCSTMIRKFLPIRSPGRLPVTPATPKCWAPSTPPSCSIFSRLRTLFALRNRYAEDELVQAIARGIDAYVILGAGLDSFAYRRPDLMASLDVFEVKAEGRDRRCG